MYAAHYIPKCLFTTELDDYLAKGWFRTGQKVFTTTFLEFNSKIYVTVWLRIDIGQFLPTNKQLKRAKLCKPFKIIHDDYTYSEELNNLYTQYINGVKFYSGSKDLRSLLSDDVDIDENNFQSKQVCIYDGDKLIACGIYDIGAKSAEGIVCFYDHNYRKYGLGLTLMYEKIQQCKNLGLEYFYPGYFVPGYSAFDYKLDLAQDGMEYYDGKNELWHPIQFFDASKSEGAVFAKKMKGLSKIAPSYGMDLSQYFNVGFAYPTFYDYRGKQPFDAPFFYQVGQGSASHDAGYYVIYYNTKVMKFDLAHLLPLSMQYLEYILPDDHITHRLFYISDVIYRGNVADEVLLYVNSHL
jgi:leucyl-tRNA---protein transferase